MNKNNRLNDDQLESISGGYVFDASNIIGHQDGAPWEVINDKGDVVGRFSDYNEAVKNAQDAHLNPEMIGWDKLQELRSRK